MRVRINGEAIYQESEDITNEARREIRHRELLVFIEIDIRVTLQIHGN